MAMDSKSLECSVTSLEQSVDRVDSKLHRLAFEIDKLEVEKLSPSTEEENSEDNDADLILLRELLLEVAKVKRSYASLRSELEQVHSMHADLTQALRQRLTQVQSAFASLQTRFTECCNSK